MIFEKRFRGPVPALFAGALALAAGLGFGAIDAKAAPYVETVRVFNDTKTCNLQSLCRVKVDKISKKKQLAVQSVSCKLNGESTLLVISAAVTRSVGKDDYPIYMPIGSEVVNGLNKTYTTQATTALYVGPGEKLMIDVTIANQMNGLVCTVVGDLTAAQ